MEHFNIEQLPPEEIEKKSFQIIRDTLRQRGVSLREKSDLKEAVLMRAIHASADFDYAETLCFSEGAERILEELVRNGADIVTDTNMALSGINKKALARFGGTAHCFMADDGVARLAKQRNVTRAAVSMEQAASIGKPVIFAIGNAPTALAKLYEMARDHVFSPAFVIGVPVGFVNVEPAKELILDSRIPHIVNRGRKGGSNIAAAICNAALYYVRDFGREER